MIAVVAIVYSEHFSCYKQCISKFIGIVGLHYVWFVLKISGIQDLSKVSPLDLPREKLEGFLYTTTNTS